MSISKIKLAANRANAAHSTGPKTPEGKATAARNATSHGMCSAVLTVFNWEIPAEFEKLRDAYMLHFQPVDLVERDLVDRLVDTTWRRNRMLSIETTLLDLEISAMDQHVEKTFQHQHQDGLLRVTLAFRERLGDRTWDAVQRYMSNTERSYSRAMKELKMLQGDRFNASAAVPVVAPDESKDSEGAEAKELICETNPATHAKIQEITDRTQIDRPIRQKADHNVGPKPKSAA